MESYGIALDLGTSGFRAQAIDLEKNKTISTAITLRHPLPGINIMDHLTFALEYGGDLAHNIIIDAVRKLISKLNIELEYISRIAVCGNPVQLSLFQGIEFRDLAWAGEHALKSHGVIPPKRDARIVNSHEIGLELANNKEVSVLIPPAIKHELGADAVAMMLKSGFLNEDLAMVADYGTNAEIALKVKDDILSGSVAAGPAIEGQSIEKGMLASPGAISDLELIDKTKCRNIILDDNMYPKSGDIVDLSTGEISKKSENSIKAKGITGTGVIAAIALGLKTGIIKPPKIGSADGKIHLQDGIFLSEKDIVEAGKAFGAFRAGFLTLCEEAGIKFEEIKIMFMAGASGFYVDPAKSKIVGTIPPTTEKIYQVGNTSLSLAADLVRDPEQLDRLQEFVEDLRAKHVMFATSEIFKKLYLLELSYWTEGMPLEKYNDFINRFGISQKIVGPTKISKIFKFHPRDIADFGEKGLTVVSDVGTLIEIELDGCKECKKCMKSCPENAILSVKDRKIRISSSLCLGTACRRCVAACPEKILDFNKAKVLI